MAVYTDLSPPEFVDLLAQYDVGHFRSAQGIAEGVENSNYPLLTTQNTYIATLFEKQIQYDDLVFFVALLQDMAECGIPCPAPIKDREGKVIQQVKGKYALLVSFLEGGWPRRIAPFHCKQLGGMLAKMHRATEGLPIMRTNPMGVPFFPALFSQVSDPLDTLSVGLRAEIATVLEEIVQHWPQGLPTGIIHADLFPDNVFFQGETLTGVLDFYFASSDFYAYDLAICLNAWCFEENLEFNITKAQLLFTEYEKIRPLSMDERNAFPLLAKASALRFFLSRSIAYLNRVEGALVKVKDPMEYLGKLRFHQKINKIEEYFP